MEVELGDKPRPRPCGPADAPKPAGVQVLTVAPDRSAVAEREHGVRSQAAERAVDQGVDRGQLRRGHGAARRRVADEQRRDLVVALIAQRAGEPAAGGIVQEALEVRTLQPPALVEARGGCRRGEGVGLQSQAEHRHPKSAPAQ